MAETVAGLLAILGAGLVALAGVGMVRLDDFYARMHAATKATTSGILVIGLAAVVGLDGGRSKVVLAVAVMFATAPSAAHVLARAAYRAENVTVDLETHDDLADLVDDT